MDEKRSYYAIAAVFGCVAIGGLISGRMSLLPFLVLAIVFAAIAQKRT